jgi:hypothetical protein
MKPTEMANQPERNLSSKSRGALTDSGLDLENLAKNPAVYYLVKCIFFPSCSTPPKRNDTFSDRP